MSRWHDPDAAVCSCFACTEARYHAAVAAHEEEDRRFRARLAAEADQAQQLRLPITPLPHCAGQPSHL